MPGNPVPCRNGKEAVVAVVGIAVVLHAGALGIDSCYCHLGAPSSDWMMCATTGEDSGRNYRARSALISTGSKLAYFNFSNGDPLSTR